MKECLIKLPRKSLLMGFQILPLKRTHWESSSHPKHLGTPYPHSDLLQRQQTLSNQNSSSRSSTRTNWNLLIPQQQRDRHVGQRVRRSTEPRILRFPERWPMLRIRQTITAPACKTWLLRSDDFRSHQHNSSILIREPTCCFDSVH